MTGEVIILTGPPGAGKTTVAERVATNADRPAVHLVTDLFYRAIHTGYVPPYLPEAQRQNEVVVEAIAAAVAAFARGGYDVVIDGIVGPWFLPPFRALGLPLTYVVLRPDLETTLSRATARAGRDLTDVEVITGLHGAFARLGELERHVLDTGALDAAASAAAVRAAVASGDFRLA